MKYNSENNRVKKSDRMNTHSARKSRMSKSNSFEDPVSDGDSFATKSDRSSAIEKDEIRLRNHHHAKANGARPRTMSSMSKKSSATSDYESEDKPPIRMTDYLEKRSKVLGWKRYWFVLDGHLLTYFKSKDDYERISPCCGSINLGIASTVRPIQIKGCKGFPLQIVTRSQAYYLRSLDKPTLDKWLLALQETTSTPPKISSPFWTDPGVQFYRYSFAALSQWSLQESSDDITGSLSNLPRNFYLNPGPPGPLKKKCHSFASLAFSDSPSSNTKKNNIYTGRSDGYYGNSSKTHKEMTELNRKSGSKVRQATSMLVLESSPQALELKRELEKKLSIGGGRPAGEERNSRQQQRKFTANVGGTGNGTGTPKLSKSLSKQDESVSGSDDNLHHYDEIIDFEAMYDNCDLRDSGASIPEDDSSGIYESVDSDPWEKLKMDQAENKRLSERERNQSSNRKSLLPISEIPEKPARNGGKNNNNLAPIIEGKKLVNFAAPSSESSQDSLILQDSAGKNLPRKKKGIAGIFQKIFKKDEQSLKRKKEKQAARRASTMVITGPVDLKSQNHIQNQPDSPTPSTSSIDSMKRAQPVEEKMEKPKKKMSPPPPGSQNVFSNEGVMDELKSKVGQLKRANSELNPSELASIARQISEDEAANEVNNKLLARRSTIQVVSELPEKKTPEKPKSLDLSENRPKITPMTLLFQNSITEYQQKLAKFNRLSAHLNPSFVAVFKQNPPNIVLGQMGRSNSCRIKAPAEEPPALPPKMRNVSAGTPNAYDYPSNNTPVVKPRSKSENVTAVGAWPGKLPSVLQLAKKNSAPDIMFPPSSLSSSRELLPHILNQHFELGDRKSFNGETSPPPRPPKKTPGFTYTKYFHSEDFVNAPKNISRSNSAEAACKSCYSHPHTVITIPEPAQVPADDNPISEVKPAQAEGGKLTVESTGKFSEYENISILRITTKSEDDKNMANASSLSEKRLKTISLKEMAAAAVKPEGISAKNIKEIKMDATVEQDQQKSQTEETEAISESKSQTEPIVEHADLKIQLEPEPIEPISLNQIEPDPKAPIEGNQNSELPITHDNHVQSNTDKVLEPPQPLILEPKDSGQENTVSTEETNVDLASPENAEMAQEIEQTETFFSLPNTPDFPKDHLSPSNFSPTLSSKSMDIDNLDALSELSDDSSAPEMLRIILPTNNRLPTSPMKSQIEAKKVEDSNTNAAKLDAVYQNIKYATINTLVTEFEVVEENYDEVSEMYDDFPCEFTTPIPPLPTPTTILTENANGLKLNQTDENKPRVQSIRHSGIDELQKYLSVESQTPTSISQNQNGVDAIKLSAGGALSRLGHSSAVDKLKREIQNN